MQRNRIISLVVAGVAVSGVGGWCAGTRVQSSSDAAAGADAPAASPITAEVELTALSSTIVDRGTVRYNDPVAVNIASGGGSGSQLVTKEPVAGTEIVEGSVMMEISGQPVLALSGSRPMYRDIRPGDTGEDVRQLEEALQRMGFEPGAVDGVFDGATAGAVEAWYEASNYEASGATDAEQEQLRGARDAVSQAQRALRTAQRSLEEGTEPPSATELAQSQNAVAAAEDALAQARTSQQQNNADAAEAIRQAEDALEDARDAEDTHNDAAERAVERAEIALTVARGALDEARAEASLPPAQHDAMVAQAELEVRSAELALEDAEDALDAVDDQSAEAIDNAERALASARSARDATVQQSAAALRRAEGDLEIANLSLIDVQTPRDSDSLRDAVQDSERDLARAQEDLARLQNEVGTYVPASNVVFFSELPLRIDSVDVVRGDTLSGAPMTVSGSRLAVETSVTIADAQLLSTGMTVELSAPDLGIDLEGTITEIADTPGTNGLDSQHVYVEIAPKDAPGNFKDAAVRVTIPVSATDGDVLAVPVAAVSVSADGSDRVEVLEDSGDRRFVTVDTGLSAEGMVEVTPIDGDLAEGDLVIVGSSSGSDG